MRALVFDPSVAKYALLKSMSRFSSDAYTGRLSVLKLRDDYPTPALRGTRWARLRTRLAGVCGSDVAAIELKSSPALSPFSSFPCVLGHEILAEIEEAPLELRDFEGTPLGEGERVVVEPLLACGVRETPACPRCREGHDVRCENATRGTLAPGLFLGFNKDLPGGWAESVVAHERMLHRVPDALSDDVAVLTEPLAVGYRAVLQHAPESGDRVLVIGGGAIAMSVLAALRALSPKADVASVSLTGFAAQAARELGAESFNLDKIGFEEVVTRFTGARAVKPLLGRGVYQGGFDVIYDCVGSERSLDDALRGARAGGRVVLVGAAARETVDWSFVWSRELTVSGVLGYGWESWEGRRVRTFEVVLDSLEADTPDAVKRLVTHHHRIEAYKETIRANQNRSDSGALKTVFDFR